MRRGLGCLLTMSVLLALPLAAAQGQVLRSEGEEPSDEDKAPTTKLILRPAAEPRMALKYQFLPGVLDRRPGNAAVLYNKIAIDLAGKEWDEAQEKASGWLKQPLADLPREEVANVLSRYDHVLRDLRLAARREQCDWQLPLGEQEDFFSILLPEVQKSRSLARLVALQARLQIAEGRLDEAVHTLQIGFAMGRHMAEGPTFVNALVGMAVCRMMCDQVRDLIQQPDAPNLYWALTALPQPLISTREAIATEMNILYLSFPELREIGDTRRSLAYWQAFLDKFVKRVCEWSGDGQQPWQARLLVTALAVKGYPMAKRRLIEQGRPAEVIEAMPVPQVVALYTMETYNEFRDQTFKWFYLPYWERRQGDEEREERLRRECEEREIFPLASLLLPALSAVQFTVARSDRDIAVLRTIEALRLYGAGHDGRLPEKLGDVTEVPTPIDPVHGKPLAYRLDGNTAVLESPAPPGKSQKSHGLRFEIKFDRAGR
jgi:hypothetical protein